MFNIENVKIAREGNRTLTKRGQHYTHRSITEAKREVRDVCHGVRINSDSVAFPGCIEKMRQHWDV